MAERFHVLYRVKRPVHGEISIEEIFRRIEFKAFQELFLQHARKAEECVHIVWLDKANNLRGYEPEKDIDVPLQETSFLAREMRAWLSTQQVAA
jgi:hypothetical protein